MLIQEFRSIDSSRRALRSFGLVVGAVFALVALILYWRHDWTAQPLEVWLAAVGAALIILGAAAPQILKPVQKVWMALALVLGYIMTRVILTIVFFGMMLPVGLLRRAFGGDPMRRAFGTDETSYWIKKTYPDDTPQRLEKLY